MVYIILYLTSSHLISLYLTPPHLTSPHLTLPHLTPPHLTSPYPTPSHLTLPHLNSPYLTSPYPTLNSPYLISPHPTLPYLTLKLTLVSWCQKCLNPLQISLIIHEENTKKISTMSETLYVIKFCSKFLLDFYG